MGCGISTITSKWQVTIPGDVRKALDVRVGERLAWEVKDGVLTAHRLPRLSALAGCLAEGGVPQGKEDSKSAMSDAAVARHQRLSGASR